ncbi:hypothetical protein [Roseibacillus persicicus]|uniref:hypothetical protein n=1 Tax=Roseibacillus persicicus TaxID=454148 RepID=UPI00280EDBA4|nr:hypothetical protein [Roseibacillus persicicus]MDQ8192423.1 hypothetical protein [Roseibacillus persicicus]
MKNKQAAARRKRRRDLKERDRWLLSLEREKEELWAILQSTPWRPLKEPFQRGWEREFLLSEEAMRRKDGEQIAAALALVNPIQRCRVFPFQEYNWKRKKMVLWVHRLRDLRPCDWRGNPVPEELLKHFEYAPGRPLSRERVSHLSRNGWSGRFVFRYPQYVTSHTRPFMVTHERVALPEVERRLSEIETALLNDNNQHRLYWLKGHSCCRWSREQYHRRLRLDERRVEKEMREAVRDFQALAEVGPGRVSCDSCQPVGVKRNFPGFRLRVFGGRRLSLAS